MALGALSFSAAPASPTASQVEVLAQETLRSIEYGGVELARAVVADTAHPRIAATPTPPTTTTRALLSVCQLRISSPLSAFSAARLTS
jgi:hypothetical protein